jgi:penicillin-binding protein 1C
MRWRRWRWAALVLLAITALLLLLRIAPHASLQQRVPVSSAVYADKGELLWLTLAADQQYRLWTPLDQVSPEYLQALRLYEDRHFGWHLGVDPAAMVRATLSTAGGQRQGGSTITMQLARMLYRLNTRTVTGKLHQITCAVWLEMRYSKRDILEAYVNLAPFGGNVQGVGAASLVYFGKPAARLTFAEALTLAVIPQSPRARGLMGKESAALRSARLQLLHDWMHRYATAQEAAVAASQPLSIGGVKQLPFLAPHLATDLLADSKPGTAMHTTVDLVRQQLLDKSVAQYIASVRDQGVTNAAALLVDTRSMAVRALVGSADFHNAEIAGQVNAITARRSPGSALKPFIYGLAIDQGLIHTQTVLKDAPTAFGAYSPENFDGAFVGPVTAHDALIASRNIPAVGLASRLAQPSLYQFLKSAGVSRMASEKHYGLALALGGGEVTMDELAGLYAMLANAGLYAPIHYRADAQDAQPLRLLSVEAAFMVRSMLADNPRPDGQPAGRTAVAWKTGTSWGFRDAWAAGIFGPYVLIVWVGNFDGSSNPAFVGTRIAAPLFFRIVDALHETSAQPDRMLYPPPGVLQVEVCAASGDLPNADCPRRSHAWYIPGKSPIRVSTIHRRIGIDTRTGLRACIDTPARFIRSDVYEFWPSDLQRLFALAGMPRRRPPEDRCTGRSADVSAAAPEIVSPASGVTYQLRRIHGESEVLRLNATASPDVRVLYWFADGAFLGSSSPSVPLEWRPTRSGQISVSAVDDAGATAVRAVRVSVLQ